MFQTSQQRCWQSIAAGVQTAGSLVQANTSRDQVIATIHTDQVFLVHHGLPTDNIPLISAAADEDVSRVLAKDKETCALQVYAFGEGWVVCDGHQVLASDWKGAQKREMFFYILLRGPLTRDEIGVVFWPDSNTKQMVNSFHTTLRHIRTVVGTEVIVNEGGKYHLEDIVYWFDVEEFEALIIQARHLQSQGRQAEHLWKHAMALCQGDFLAEASRTLCVKAGSVEGYVRRGIAGDRTVSFGTEGVRRKHQVVQACTGSKRAT